MLRVATDVTPLLTPRTGVGVFVDQLLTRLACRDDLAIAGYAVTWRGRRQLASAVPNGVRVVDRPMAARPLHQMWMRTNHPRIERWTGRCDVVWGTNYVVPPTRGTSIVSIYDLTPMRFPELADHHTRTFPRLIGRALRRGAWVHTLSNFVRDEIVEHFGIEPERIHVIPGGVRPASPASGAGSAPELPPLRSCRLDPHERTPAGARESPTGGQPVVGDGPYILALGTVEPRKDLPTLVTAFDQLAARFPELRLVIAGADGWGADSLSAAIARSRHRDRILRLGWVDETDRAALLGGASVFAYPSIYEGFGFPPLEAMNTGVPVVATRTGSLPEVCGDAAELVPVGEPDVLAASLEGVMVDQARRAELVHRGRSVAAGYSWSLAADRFASLLQSLPR